MPPLLTPKVLTLCIAIAVTIALTSSCCAESLLPAPGVKVVDAEGNAVDGLVLHLLAPGGEAILLLEGNQAGIYGVDDRELAAGTYEVVLDSDEYVISGADELVVLDYGMCSNNTGSVTITVVPTTTN